MAETRSSRSNIAANFKFPPAKYILPPIGVFWDIENCQVPKGKSAIALIQHIRHTFFARHREAEFMCVCDINKESKTIIQELNLAQVTVVHVNATSKNAADDKLKQCMRRFVDVHGTPSTILLISDDVNFATDLSDFRHRHNVRIILLHTAQAPQPLLTCAHEHYDFFEIASRLPFRSPSKVAGNRSCELIVTDLPTNKVSRQIQNKLKQLSDNCGGKVLSVCGTSAILRFTNADAARRAQKRMDKELVFGKKISVNFAQKSDERDSSPYQVTPSKLFQPIYHQGFSSSSSRESSPASQKEYDTRRHGDTKCRKRFDFPPPPVIDRIDYPGESIHYSTDTVLGSFSDTNARSDNSQAWNHDFFGSFLKNEDSGSRNSTCSSYSSDNTECGHFNPNQSREQVDNSNFRCLQKNVGRVSPFVMPESSLKSSAWSTAFPIDMPSASRSNVKPISNGFSGDSSIRSVHGYHSVGHCSGTFNATNRPAEYSNPGLNSHRPPAEISHPVGRANPIISSGFSAPVDLAVTNLDQSFEVNEMKKLLLSVFREHVMVLHISMILQPDNSLKALVKVPSFQDAQYAISQLHRRKIGYKRILISYSDNERNPPLPVLRSEVFSLLNDIPSKKLPLFKFRELFEKRYLRTISVSDLYKMRDTIYIQEESSGRMVCLNSDSVNTPSSTDSESCQESQILEKPYCEHHFHISEAKGWAEPDSTYPLPVVCMSLKALAPAVHTLLDTHQGSLPLNSFCACYEAEFGPLPIINGYNNVLYQNESSSTDSEYNGSAKGVPLEHLVACIPGVQIAKSPLCIKKIQWLENKPTDIQILGPTSFSKTLSGPTCHTYKTDVRNNSPALAGQLALFTREMTDLLKGQPHSTIPFNKFIPTYHHHFGRQCRVADYGFTKLIDLLEAIPHVVQILGQGHNRLLTLTHRAQVKRFVADLLRILKSRASKQIALPEFTSAYEQCIEKPFDVTDYGICEIEDLLNEVSENIIVIDNSGGDTIISIPKREQTQEEIEKTKQFAAEVVELLKHTPSCSMTFNKFIPAYHHHFGKQCRVADYGFSKLIELFEAIPDVLSVHGCGEDKILKLTEREHRKIMSERLAVVVRTQPHHSIPMNQLAAIYAKMHGHILRPSDLGASDLHELLQILKGLLKVIDSSEGPIVTLVDRGFIHLVSLRIRWLLMEQEDGEMSVEKLSQVYQKRFGHSINLESFSPDLEDVAFIKDGVISLSPVQLLARDLIVLLREQGNSMSLQNVESSFLKRFGTPCKPAQHGFTSLNAMIGSLSDYFTVKGRKNKKIVVLNKDAVVSPLLRHYSPKPFSVTAKPVAQVKKVKPFSNKPLFNMSSGVKLQLQKDKELFLRNIPVDLLSQPIPSNVPSPDLEPEQNKAEDHDLMGFESPPSLQGDTSDKKQKEESKSEQPNSTPTKQENSSPSLKVLMTLPDSVLEKSPSHPSTIQQYAVFHQYNTLAPYPGIQGQPVAYYVDTQTQYAQSSPTVILHQSSIVPIHAVVSPPTVGTFEHPSGATQSTPTSAPVNIIHSTLTGVNISPATLACVPQSGSSSIIVPASPGDTDNLTSKTEDVTHEDMNKMSNLSLESNEETALTSTLSTPSHSERSRSRNRIAAQFTIPLTSQP